MTNEPIGWTITWDLKDAEAFKEVAKETAAAVKESEPDTMVYEWCESEDGKTVTLIEWFSGLDGAKAHIKGVAPSKYLPRLNEQGDLTSLHVYGDPDGELRDMVAGLNPTGFHKEIAGFNRAPVHAVA